MENNDNINATITISVKEYDAFKARIKELEEACVQKDKDIEVLIYNNGKYQDIVEYLIEDITPMERIFQWKAIVRAVNDSISEAKL